MQVTSALHILCFGDSLTNGWTELGAEAHPYAIAMVASLQKSFPSINITTDVQGLPGDQVVSPPGGFLPRIDILYEETKIPYDWAIILGGTNDLTLGRGSKDVWEGLKKVYDFPLKNKTKVLALTIPECGYCGAATDEHRNEINKGILEYQVDNFYTYDLYAAFPYWNLTEARRREIWHDGTHPNEAGYDIWGSLLGARLKELISGSGEADEVAQHPLTELRKREAEPVAEDSPIERRVLRSGRIVGTATG